MEQVLTLQALLLRLLEDGRVSRIGETSDRAVNVRVIAATHRDLDSLVRGGRFREDLFFRLSTVPVDVPPLRARRDDITRLFTTFLQQSCARNQRVPMTIDAAAMEALRAYDWPGNVRELRNIAERLSVFGTDPVTIDQLPSDVLPRLATAAVAILHIAETGAVVPL